jgi:dTDP-4-amino-4,6-dideoxygalactose transaminase
MHLFLGPNVTAFEREFARYCSAADAIGVSSGSDALFAALGACGVGPGDEVIAPAHTFFATIGAIIHAGATPVFVDVDAETLTIDVSEVEAAISPSTRAIMPVHIYGQPADMDPILAVARQHGLRVIEDCAQAHGARYFGRPCGSLGDVGCFSFYMSKNLGALGEAGLATTNDPDIAERVRLLRNHGRTSRCEHEIAGFNMRLDEIQALVLRLKLPGLDAGNARRRSIAQHYAAAFRSADLQVPASKPQCESVYHIYPIRTPARDALRAHLERHGIETAVHYPVPAHRQKALQMHPHRICRLDVTEAVCPQLLSLPIYPELTDAQVDFIAESVLDFFRDGVLPGRARS